MFSTVLKYDTSVLNDINFIEKVVYTWHSSHSIEWRLNDTKWTKAVVETIDNICWKIVFTSFNKQTTSGGELKIIIS